MVGRTSRVSEGESPISAQTGNCVQGSWSGHWPLQVLLPSLWNQVILQGKNNYLEIIRLLWNVLGTQLPIMLMDHLMTDAALMNSCRTLPKCSRQGG